MTLRRNTTEKTHSVDGSRTLSELDRRAQEVFDAQATVVRCAFCDWSFEGTAGEGRAAAAEHRQREHPPPKSARAALAAQRDALAAMDAGEPQAPRPPTSPANGARAPRPPKWTREALIERIQAWAAEHDGVPPTSYDWRNRPGWPSASSVKLRFGSFAGGIEAAGFERPTRGGRRRTSLREPEPKADKTARVDTPERPVSAQGPTSTPAPSGSRSDEPEPVPKKPARRKQERKRAVPAVREEPLIMPSLEILATSDGARPFVEACERQALRYERAAARDPSGRRRCTHARGTQPRGRSVTPYVQDADFTLYQGDAREALAQLEPDSVNCVVTSPPYYLLRDYGTATWTGGDPDCDHLAPMPGGTARSGLANYDNGLNETTIASKVAVRRQQYRGECRKCGALRADEQIGLEDTLDQYVAALIDVFDEVRRVLRPDGVVWLNLGDTHCSAPRGPRHGRTSKLTTPERQERVSPVVNKRGRAPGVKPKDLFGVPFEVALALRDDGWWLRQTVIWDKTNTIPESAKDRPTTSHEYVFLLARSRRYWFDADAIAEPATWERWGAQTQRKEVVGKAQLAKRNEKADVPVRATRNARSVWRLNAAQFYDDHSAVMPDELAERCIRAGAPPGGLVLDPFAGAGTTAAAARRLGRRSIAIELSEKSCAIAARRMSQQTLLAEAIA